MDNHSGSHHYLLSFDLPGVHHVRMTSINADGLAESIMLPITVEDPDIPIHKDLGISRPANHNIIQGLKAKLQNALRLLKDCEVCPCCEANLGYNGSGHAVGCELEYMLRDLEK